MNGQEAQDTVLSSLLGTIMGDWKPVELLGRGLMRLEGWLVALLGA